MKRLSSILFMTNSDPVPLKSEAPAIYNKVSWGGPDSGPARFRDMRFKRGSPLENGYVCPTAVSGALALSQGSFS